MEGGQSKDREFMSWRVAASPDKVFNDCVVV